MQGSNYQTAIHSGAPVEVISRPWELAKWYVQSPPSDTRWTHPQDFGFNFILHVFFGFCFYYCFLTFLFFSFSGFDEKNHFFFVFSSGSRAFPREAQLCFVKRKKKHSREKHNLTSARSASCASTKSIILLSEKRKAQLWFRKKNMMCFCEKRKKHSCASERSIALLMREAQHMFLPKKHSLCFAKKIEKHKCAFVFGFWFSLFSSFAGFSVFVILFCFSFFFGFFFSFLYFWGTCQVFLYSFFSFFWWKRRSSKPIYMGFSFEDSMRKIRRWKRFRIWTHSLRDKLFWNNESTGKKTTIMQPEKVGNDLCKV